MSIMSSKRYSQEFKNDAVNLVESGIAVKRVARDLGVGRGTLQGWLRDHRLSQYGFLPGC